MATSSKKSATKANVNVVSNNVASNKKSKVSEKSVALNHLRDANKEQKTLSGVLKTIKTFWNDGYKDAFAYVGLDYNGLKELRTISTLFPNVLRTIKDEKVVLNYYKKVARLDEKGEFVTVTNSKGKASKVYDKVITEISVWTVNRLFDCLLEGKIERAGGLDNLLKAGEKTTVATAKAGEKETAKAA